MMYIHRLACAECVRDADRGSRRCNNLIERDWRGPARPNAFCERMPSGSVPLILPQPGMERLLLAMSHEFEPPEIVEHRCAAGSEHLNPLLREGAVAIAQI